MVFVENAAYNSVSSGVFIVFATVVNCWFVVGLFIFKSSSFVHVIG